MDWLHSTHPLSYLVVVLLAATPSLLAYLALTGLLDKVFPPGHRKDDYRVLRDGSLFVCGALFVAIAFFMGVSK